MTIEKIQCEHCSSSILNTNIRKHQRTKKCQKVQEEKIQREEREREEKEKEENRQSPVKESNDEKIQCEWCGTIVIEKHLRRHLNSKKCMRIRLKENENKTLDEYICRWCKDDFKTQKELSIHKDGCLKGKIAHLKDELREQKEEYECKIEDLREYYERKIKELREEHKLELKDKDDFIKNLAKEPKHITTNNNTFNLNNYFKGNSGIDFTEEALENKIQQCKELMSETVDKHGFSNMKKIRDVKEKQIDLLCKDENTKKWNVVNTDASRNTYTVCKRINDKMLTVKDHNGNMMKMILDKVDRLNNRCYYKVLAENTHLQGSMFYELEDNCNILVKESLWDKIPSKAMLCEKEIHGEDNIIEIN